MSVLAGRPDVAAARYLEVPEPDPEAVREALRAVLDWQESVEPGAPSSILNACRAWYVAALAAARVRSIVSRAREALA